MEEFYQSTWKRLSRANAILTKFEVAKLNAYLDQRQTSVGATLTAKRLASLNAAMAVLNLTSTLASNTVSADNLRLAIDLTSIVAHLHEHHSTPLVHRDLDPANIVFVDGQVKLIDFNEGQLIPRRLNNITSSSNMPAPAPCYPHGIPVGGNIDDKPLEIIHRDVVTEKVDVYQLGALFLFHFDERSSGVSLRKFRW